MSNRPKMNRTVTAAQARNCEVLQPLLTAMYQEFQELSKKKPEGPVNKIKVKVVNRLLEPVLALLEDEPDRVFLNLIDNDDLPENSDVVLMLGQALTAIRSFRHGSYETLTGWAIGDVADEKEGK